MNTRRLLLVLSAMMLTPFVLSGQARCPGDVEPIRYHPVGYSQIAVFVAINGMGPYEFLVDTGSEVTVIEPSLAAELELKPDADIDVLAVGSHSKAELATLDLIEVGPIAVRRPLVVVAPLLQIHRALDRKIRGLLGGSFLGHFDLLIDYAHKFVCFDETKQMLLDVHGEHVPLVENSDSQQGLSFAHSPVIVAHIGGNGSRDVLLMLDSASNSPLLYATHPETPAWLLRNHAQLGSVVGRGPQLMFAMLPSQGIRIGSRVLPDVAFVFPLSTGSSAITTGDDGLLPTALFKRVFISYANHFVIFDPR